MLHYAARNENFALKEEKLQNMSEPMSSESYSTTADHFYKAIFLAVSFGIMFGGAVPYFFQYKEINRTKNTAGFSLFVCFNLLMASILKVLFWLGKQFELQLLIQSITMILVMLVMIYTSIRINNMHILPPKKINSVWEGHVISHFWKWSDFSSYLFVIFIFSFAGLSITYILIDLALYHEIVGFLALSMEAIVVMPQLITNWRRKTTKGLSFAMILTLTLGDLFKTVYFVVRVAPIQFSLCGFFQCCFDLAILAQIALYSLHGGRSRSYDVTEESSIVKNDIVKHRA